MSIRLYGGGRLPKPLFPTSRRRRRSLPQDEDRYLSKIENLSLFSMSCLEGDSQETRLPLLRSSRKLEGPQDSKGGPEPRRTPAPFSPGADVWCRPGSDAPSRNLPYLTCASAKQRRLLRPSPPPALQLASAPN